MDNSTENDDMALLNFQGNRDNVIRNARLLYQVIFGQPRKSCRDRSDTGGTKKRKIATLKAWRDSQAMVLKRRVDLADIARPDEVKVAARVVGAPLWTAKMTGEADLQQARQHVKRLEAVLENTVLEDEVADGAEVNAYKKDLMKRIKKSQTEWSRRQQQHTPRSRSDSTGKPMYCGKGIDEALVLASTLD